ncbi:MAG: hypothetical protein AAFW73_22370 [Bacteroidota bacterium]
MMHSDRELGWANFWNFEQYGFHETFMRALSEQLLEEAQQMVGGKDLPQFGFRLYYGLAPIDWESRGQSGSTTVSLLVPPSFMLPIRVGWTTTELLPEDWYRRALAPGAATFSWADHFPLDQVRSQLRPQRTITSKQTQHPFPIEIYPTSLPDISLGLTFDQALTTVECQTADIAIAAFQETWNQKKGVRLINHLGKLIPQDAAQYLIVADLGKHRNFRPVYLLLGALERVLPDRRIVGASIE